jgi:hypothetical protein
VLRLSGYGFAIALLFTLALTPAAVLADCPDGDENNNTLNCTTSLPDSSNPDTNLDGGAGNDNITVNENVSLGNVFGDNTDPSEAAGDDTININGDVEYVSGDYTTTAGGNDSITIGSSGSASGYVAGDDNNGDAGEDTIRVNGSVALDVIGDYTDGNGANDSITINGTVGEDVVGDGLDSDTREFGNDTITINGQVDGAVYGDGVYTDFNPTFTTNETSTGGDDLITLQNGANGGDDSLLEIYGEGGTDTLRFDFRTESQDEYDQFIADFALAVASTDIDGSGTITWGGQTFTWTSIEELQNLIRLIVAESGGSGSIVLTTGPGGIQDGRLNSDPAAPAVLYCAPDGGFVVYAIDANGNGYVLYSVTGAQVSATVAALGGVVSSVDGSSITVDGVGNATFAFGAYSFSFSAAACGAAI